MIETHRRHHPLTYARARLWIGVSAVGTLVLASGLSLALGLPELIRATFGDGIFSGLAALGTIVLIYAVIHVPFDVMGGFVLPRRFGKSHQSPGVFFPRYARGVLAHGATLFAAGTLLLVGGAAFGWVGVAGISIVLSLLLLLARPLLMTLIGGLSVRRRSDGPAPRTPGGLRIWFASSSDVGFTGGIHGVFRARHVILPHSWQKSLSLPALDAAVDRRYASVRSGSWVRGRAIAVVFTWIGLLFCAWIVGDANAGTASGLIEFALFFTLWSFAGLLTLPTVSRRGVHAVDRSLRARGYDEDALRQIVAEFDDLQDGERDRSAGIEAIFHPIPSVTNRSLGTRVNTRFGGVDAARTAIFLSASGLSLLGRAVHCNCGRPELWVFLPCD